MIWIALLAIVAATLILWLILSIGIAMIGSAFISGSGGSDDA